MKIIHTGDWHLGNRLFRVDRTEENRFFLNWLKTEIEEQKAEVLVVSGDIFDTWNPPTEARTMYIDFLASLNGTCCKNIIIIGGNHDSGTLLDSEKEILEILDIHVVGILSSLQPEDMVFELKDRDGEVAGICCAVPFAPEMELKKYCTAEYESGGFSDAAYGELYRQVCAKALELRGERDIPVIATGHLYAAGLEGRLSGEIRESEASDDGKRSIDVVGNLGSVHSDIFPNDFDYTALGHIHYTTKVGGNGKIRYSGSPFVMGFDECKIGRCVLAVDVKKGEEPEVQKIEVPSKVFWVRAEGTLEEIKKTLQGYIKNPPEKETNIEVYYDFDETRNVNDFIQEELEKLPENVFVVHFKRKDNPKIGTISLGLLDESGFDSEGGTISDEDIFKTLILSKIEIDKEDLDEEGLSEKQKELFDTYLPLLMQARDFEPEE